MNKHTYIIDHYNPSVRIIDLVSHTTYVVFANFIYKRRSCRLTPNYRFFEKLSKSTPNDGFFEKLFMAILLTLRVFGRNLLRGICQRNTFHILF